MQLTHRIKLLLCITLFGIIIRLIGIYPGYGLNHPDEPIIAESARRIALHLDFAPVGFYYGGLLPFIFGLALLHIFIPLDLIFNLLFHSDTTFQAGLTSFFQHLEKSDVLFGYWARIESALLSSMVIVFTYLVGQRLFSKPVGLISAFLIAVNYRHVLSSSMVLADAPSAIFGLLAILTSSLILSNPSWRHYMLSGFAIGLALSVKYFYHALWPFLLCHFLTSINQQSLTSKLRSLFLNPKFYISLILAIITFLIINPFVLIKWRDFLWAYNWNATNYGVNQTINPLNLSHISAYQLFYLYHFAYGPLLSLLIIIGSIYGLKRYFKSSLLILSVALPFLYFFIIISGRNLVRNDSAIMPLWLFFPSLLIVDLVNQLSRATTRKLLIVGLTLIISLPSLFNSTLSALYFSRPHNHPQAREWLRQNIPAGQLFVYTYGVPTPSDGKYIDRFFGNQTPLPWSISQLAESKINWLAVSSDYTGFEDSEKWSYHNSLIFNHFLNRDLFVDIMKNSYTGLLLQELADYRVAEFVKPYWQGLDPATVIIKVPDFWQLKQAHLIRRFDFTNPPNLWPGQDFNHQPLPIMSLSLEESSPSAKLSILVEECSELMEYQSPNVSTTPKHWYSLTASAKRQTNLNNPYEATFLRLNFYDSNNHLIKTFVSQAIPGDNTWLPLRAAGFAPSNATQANISLAIDQCNQDQRIWLGPLELYQSNLQPPLSGYPFYDRPLSNSFFWLPSL